MESPPAPGTVRALRRFRRLVAAAILSTFLLVLVGGVVRVADSGLGCGPPGGGLRGWPLCQGRLVPNDETHTVLEYEHRFLAAVVVILLVAMLWQALWRLRDERRLVRGSAAAALLVLAQAVLGGLTVEHGLRTALVAAHLGTAMLLLGVLLALYLDAGRRSALERRAPRSPLPLAALAATLVLITIVSGGVVAGTEQHGALGGSQREGAHLACGREFPTCNGAILPYGGNEMVDIQLAHRTAMLLAAAAVAALALLLFRRRALGAMPLVIVTALVGQILLGASNVWFGEHGWLVVAHLGLGTLLWMLLAGTALALAGAGERHHDAGGAVRADGGLSRRVNAPPLPAETRS